MSTPSRRRGRAAHARVATVERMTGAVIGTVVGFRGGEVWVSVPGNGTGPLVARALAEFDDATLEHAAHERADAVLLFEEGDPARPLLVGLLRSRTPLVDAILLGPLPPADKVARVDGKRVVIEGKEEVTLQCGEATLTLRCDGAVILKGVNVVSQAKRVHKIRGGKVQVN